MIRVINTGDPLRQNLDDLQAQIATLQLERKETATARVTHDELRDRCRREAHRLLGGAPGAARIRYLAQPGNPPALVVRDDGPIEIAALITLLVGEQTVADRLFEVAIADETYAPGLPVAERTSHVAALDTKLHHLMIAEELEARKLEANGGVFVMRRSLADIDIEAILEAWNRATA